MSSSDDNIIRSVDEIISAVGKLVGDIQSSADLDPILKQSALHKVSAVAGQLDEINRTLFIVDEFVVEVDELSNEPDGVEEVLKPKLVLTPVAQPKDDDTESAEPEIVSESDEAAADDLSLIFGVDEAAIGVLFDKGVSTFADIAAFNEADMMQVSHALHDPGRVARENWIEQAVLLQDGSGTFYAKRLTGDEFFDRTSFNDAYSALALFDEEEEEFFDDLPPVVDGVDTEQLSGEPASEDASAEMEGDLPVLDQDVLNTLASDYLADDEIDAEGAVGEPPAFLTNTERDDDAPSDYGEDDAIGRTSIGFVSSFINNIVSVEEPQSDQKALSEQDELAGQDVLVEQDTQSGAAFEAGNQAGDDTDYDAGIEVEYESDFGSGSETDAESEIETLGEEQLSEVGSEDRDFGDDLIADVFSHKDGSDQLMEHAPDEEDYQSTASVDVETYEEVDVSDDSVDDHSALISQTLLLKKRELEAELAELTSQMKMQTEEFVGRDVDDFAFEPEHVQPPLVDDVEYGVDVVVDDAGSEVSLSTQIVEPISTFRDDEDQGRQDRPTETELPAGPIWHEEVSTAPDYVPPIVDDDDDDEMSYEADGSFHTDASFQAETFDNEEFSEHERPLTARHFHENGEQEFAGQGHFEYAPDGDGYNLNQDNVMPSEDGLAENNLGSDEGGSGNERDSDSESDGQQRGAMDDAFLQGDIALPNKGGLPDNGPLQNNRHMDGFDDPQGQGDPLIETSDGRFDEGQEEDYWSTVSDHHMPSNGAEHFEGDEVSRPLKDTDLEKHEVAHTKRSGYLVVPPVESELSFAVTNSEAGGEKVDTFAGQTLGSYLAQKSDVVQKSGELNHSADGAVNVAEGETGLSRSLAMDSQEAFAAAGHKEVEHRGTEFNEPEIDREVQETDLETGIDTGFETGDISGSPIPPALPPVAARDEVRRGDGPPPAPVNGRHARPPHSGRSHAGPPQLPATSPVRPPVAPTGLPPTGPSRRAVGGPPQRPPVPPVPPLPPVAAVSRGPERLPQKIPQRPPQRPQQRPPHRGPGNEGANGRVGGGQPPLRQPPQRQDPQRVADRSSQQKKGVPEGFRERAKKFAENLQKSLVEKE